MRQSIIPRTSPPVPRHCGLSLVCDAQGDDLEVSMLLPRSSKANFNALQNGAPDLQRVMLDPSASTAHA